MQPPRKTRHPALPDAFTRRIGEQFPQEHAAFAEALDRDPVTSIRLNPHKWNRVRCKPDFLGDAVPWSRNGHFLNERPAFTFDPLFHAGSYYVQEASSMFLEHVLTRLSLSGSYPDLILDACAAPGGKATLMAALFPDSLVVSNEIIRSRVPPLIENSIKWGTGNILITQNATPHFGGLPDFFDLVVTDVPCSGEGLFRKDPFAREEWTADNARHCSLRQRSIVTDLWPAVRPGGHLVYTTCTFNPEENERNVAWLLDQTGGECVQVSLPAEADAAGRIDARNPGSITEVTDGPVTGYGFYPHRTVGEGFFLSVIRKRDPDCTRFGNSHESSGKGESGNKSIGSKNIGIGSIRNENIRSKNTGGGSGIIGDEHIPESGSRWRTGNGSRSRGKSIDRKRTRSSFGRATNIQLPDPEAVNKARAWFRGNGFDWYQIHDRLFRIHSSHLDTLQHISRVLAVRYAGTEAGRVLRGEVRPAASAALDIHLDPAAFPQIDAATGDALAFLRRENLPVPKNARKGWYLVMYEGLPLGWSKNVGSRMNNYYPSEWRIRKAPRR
ncbi:MAG: hypothetical protein R6U28_11250 [Cyclonatronaceae bacterium]